MMFPLGLSLPPYTPAGEILADFFVFNFLPYLLGILFPVIICFALVTWKIRDNQLLNKIIKKWILIITLTIIITNVIWEQFIFNHVYYEWDRLGLPFTLFSFESPLIDGSSSWLAKGWSQLGLYGVWLLLVISNYLLATIITYVTTVKKDRKQIAQILRNYTIILILISAIIGQFLNRIILIPMFLLASPLFMFFRFIHFI